MFENKSNITINGMTLLQIANLGKGDEKSIAKALKALNKGKETLP